MFFFLTMIFGLFSSLCLSMRVLCVYVFLLLLSLSLCVWKNINVKYKYAACSGAGRLYSTDNFSSFVFLFSVGKCLICTHTHTISLHTHEHSHANWSQNSLAVFCFNAAVCLCAMLYMRFICAHSFHDFYTHNFFFCRLYFAYNFLLQAFSPLFHVNIDYIVWQKASTCEHAFAELEWVCVM